MVLGFGQTKTEDVAGLIAKKNYAKAIEVIKAQLATGRPDPRLRLQLADVLISSGRDKDAVNVLIPLADEYAKEGFAAKAVSVLKRIQKIDPGRRDVEARLASMIQDRQRDATIVLPPPARELELGIEEIGFDPQAGPVAVPARAVPARDEAPPPVTTDFALAPEPPPTAPPPPRAVPPRAVAPVVDRDLISEEEEGGLPLAQSDFVLVEPMAEEAEPAPVADVVEKASSNPMSDGAFAEEVLGLLENAFPSLDMEAPSAPGTAPAPPIVVSPLFKDFSVDEMVAVIHGLELLTFDAGEIIITQGDPGNSLYILSSGSVKAFIRNAAGRQAQVGVFGEGAFFGEGSILTGKPRAATIVAATRCELLELDRKTLDSITKTHPHVWNVLEEFARQRTSPPKG